MQMSGMLLVDKPKGMTSHDVVDILRKKINIKKIGHAGTLDPEATGLLLLLISRQATKKAPSYAGLPKRYEARMILGIKTDTADHTGNLILKRNVPSFSDKQIEDAFKSFRGEILQVPPMVSAKKIGGKKLYKLARKGITIKREAQKISIKELEIKKIALPEVHFSLECSKGTYVRTLCEDIGEALGCGAHMSGLRRTQVGDFKLKNAISVSDIKQSSTSEIQEKLIEI